ncbi:hypothetical protein CJJ17_27335 [Gordonia polyisoprenivorans]|nr:hypothetical protein CJJ17_27335 [Gordonia polyisoprenivorans]
MTDDLRSGAIRLTPSDRLMGAPRLSCFVVATDPGVYPHTWWARAARPGAGSPPMLPTRHGAIEHRTHAAPRTTRAEPHSVPHAHLLSCGGVLSVRVGRLLVMVGDGVRDMAARSHTPRRCGIDDTNH